MRLVRTTLAHALPLILATLVGAAGVRAQDTYTYLVRDVDGGYRVGGSAPDSVAPDSFDFSADRDPLRVVQSPEFTWVVHDGDDLTRDNAVMILSRNVPVRPGAGDVVVRGWRPARVAHYDSFSVSFTRGDQDREVAGHTAHHYHLRSHIERTGEMGGPQRYDYDADLWVIPDMPHSWAPFGFGTQSLPALAPRLRDSLDVRLAELGLVGRAVIHLDFAMLRNGEDAGGSRQTTAFEVSWIQSADSPPTPGPVVDRSVMTSLQDRILAHPATMCMAADQDRLPEGLEGVSQAAKPAVLATIARGCASPELYFQMIEERLKTDTEATCRDIQAADDPAAMARAIFTDEQSQAFMDFVSDADRIRFKGELERYCRR
jgi:hypothetical protein